MSNMYFSPPVFRNMPPGVKGLLVACLAGFFLPRLSGPEITGLFGLVPRQVTGEFWVWQLVTYLFLHGGVFHLLLNMFALWMFGRVIEFHWGTREFIKYFFFTGICAGALNLLLSPNSTIPIIGASGAIYGLLVAFAVLFPDAVLYLYFFIPLRAKQAVILFAVLELMAGFASMGHGIANFAHLGGIVAGYIYLKKWQALSGVRNLFRRISAKKTVHKQEKRARRQVDLSREVDRILDKIIVQGTDSLTEDEKQIMRKYSSMKKGTPNA